MDTEAFLLRRRQLEGRLDARRAAALAEAEERRGPRVFGLPIFWWARLAAGGLKTRTAMRWLLQLLLPTLVPAAVAFAKSKSGDNSKRKNVWSLLADVFSFVTLRRRS